MVAGRKGDRKPVSPHFFATLFVYFLVVVRKVDDMREGRNSQWKKKMPHLQYEVESPKPLPKKDFKAKNLNSKQAKSQHLLFRVFLFTKNLVKVLL